MSKGSDLIEQLEIPGYGADEVAMMEITLIAAQPEFIGEWGTNRGSSARIFYELCLIHGIDPLIVTVDLPDELAALDRDHAGIFSGGMLSKTNVCQMRGDGVTTALLMWHYEHRPERSVFFLDGDHLKESVFREIVLVNRMAPKATMLLHDTTQGPGQAVRDYLERFPDQYDLTELHSQAGMMRLMARNG